MNLHVRSIVRLAVLIVAGAAPCGFASDARAAHTAALPGPASAVVADETGGALVAGTMSESGFLTHVDARGTSTYVRTWPTSLGGPVAAMARDARGQTLLVGTMTAPHFPGGYDLFPRPTSTTPRPAGFLLRYTADGTLNARIYIDTGNGVGLTGMTTDRDGSIYLAGWVEGLAPGQPVRDRPTGCLSSATSCKLDLVIKLIPDATQIEYLSVVGDADAAGMVQPAVDDAGEVYLLRPHPAQVVKLNATGDTVMWSRTLPAPSARGLAVDGRGNAYITGRAGSRLKATAHAFQRARRGPSDAYVIKLTPQGQKAYITRLGGSRNDEGRAIAVSGSGIVSLTGSTESPDFPTAHAVRAHPGTRGCASTSTGVCSSVFVAQLNNTGSVLRLGSYLGKGGSTDAGTVLSVGPTGDLVVAGIIGQTNAVSLLGLPTAYFGT